MPASGDRQLRLNKFERWCLRDLVDCDVVVWWSVCRCLTMSVLRGVYLLLT